MQYKCIHLPNSVREFLDVATLAELCRETCGRFSWLRVGNECGIAICGDDGGDGDGMRTGNTVTSAETIGTVLWGERRRVQIEMLRRRSGEVLLSRAARGYTRGGRHRELRGGRRASP